ncbi:hypothetical protein MKW98_026381 [Papaver atlanticum]|uniref:No apical meristem-associated C-terminal domain-containing protein n=1 Tax=Papaver atlanticum TaxID=357466 RepID=A0AAD4XIZ4_9MAGN|nr:hypothetical protein MKW98_026381 [Papaver atlanticum]
MKGNPNDRDKTSLENRIYAIKKDIKLFIAVLGKLYRGGRISGYGAEHTLIRVRCDFHKIHGRPFILDECYEIYKSEPGYDYTKYVDIPPLPPPPVVQVVDDIGVEGVHGADGVEEEETGVDCNTSDTQVKKKRGPGKKALHALKQAKYQCGTSSDSIESNFGETNERMLSYLKEPKEQLKEENISRIKEKKKARVERIMMADISKLSNAGQVWLERKQKKILEKRNLMEQESSDDE